MTHALLATTSLRTRQVKRLLAVVLGFYGAIGGYAVAGEIIVGGGPVVAPGGSVSSQNARDLRQRATFERLKGDHDDASPNIIIVNPNVAPGVVNEWWVPTSPAAHGAAYNRARANENRILFDDDDHSAMPATVIGVPAGVVPRPVVTTPQEQSAARNAARANAYRQRRND